MSFFSDCQGRKVAKICGNVQWSITPSSGSGHQVNIQESNKISSGWGQGSATVAEQNSKQVLAPSHEEKFSLKENHPLDMREDSHICSKKLNLYLPSMTKLLQNR